MSASPQSPLTLWLPALNQCGAGVRLHRLLSRADRLPDGSTGYLDGLGAGFEGLDANLPAAALTRELLTGDAGNALWLSADPAWVQPDMNGVRLLACGRLQLRMEEAQGLAAAVRPVFEDASMQLEVSTPDRWHLKLPDQTALPHFVPPEQALGEDLAQHLPQGAGGRRWRVLLNDLQVVLHQHPLNGERRARGLAPINSLWLWGGGTLPERLQSAWSGVLSDDLLLNALAERARITRQARNPASVADAKPGWLIDLQDVPAADLDQLWWPVLEPLLGQRACVLHFASGERWLHQPSHRWRFWRGAGR